MARRAAADGRGTTVRAARRPELRLPPLVPFGDGGLEPDGDYDALDFAETDLTGQDGAGARFMDCALTGCALDEASLPRARLLDSVLTGVRGVGTNLAEATLRDVELRDARLGGTQLHGAVLERVLIRGGKIDYLNLRRSRLKDVVFESCVLVEPDFGGARLELHRVALRRRQCCTQDTPCGTSSCGRPASAAPSCTAPYWNGS
ncbi:pentapeptide repeat-containing protein [Streptomyces sp. WAC 04229]|uniref:pentapeptide repeat-containing protein n=1 Tax=Streptomyces sp. WAC 04229 TaxID=2203206 RepID=UPI0021AD7F3F|nr:pentapeptide repeat-containing protein [Streptomyces sp. WAC 04229]